MKLTVTGLDELHRKLQAGMDASRTEAPGALHDVAQEGFAVSQRMCPVDTGSLRSSGNVKGPDVSGNTAEVEVGYGGSSAPYAIYVHEDLEARHDPPTQAKFLETPFRDVERDLAQKIERAIEARIRAA